MVSNFRYSLETLGLEYWLVFVVWSKDWVLERYNGYQRCLVSLEFYMRELRVKDAVVLNDNLYACFEEVCIDYVIGLCVG